MLKRRIIVALVFAALIIGGTALIRFAGSSATQTRSAAEALVQNVIADSLQEDADRDGLKNWEEALHKTDPDDPDTDGDGSFDGDEVEEGRDPAVPGPDDKREVTGIKTEIVDKVDPNATDVFSYELFAKYIEAKQQGKAIDEETATEIAEVILSQGYATETPEFDPKILTIVDSSTMTTLKAYGNELGAVLTEPLPDDIDPEIEILEKIAQGDLITEEDKAMLRVISARYQRMIGKLSSMAVPAIISKTHARLIDGITLLYEGVIGIQMFSSDPIGAYSRIANYGSGLDLLEIVLLDYREFFKQKGVIFSSVESGYTFVE